VGANGAPTTAALVPPRHGWRAHWSASAPARRPAATDPDKPPHGTPRFIWFTTQVDDNRGVARIDA
jgi:hypothetical protein